MIMSAFILACIGLAISAYTYMVDNNLKANPNYKPVCDISDRVSCSKTIKSPYGNLFFFSNAIAGVIFYSVVGTLAFFSLVTPLIIAAIIGFSCSCILAYLLYIKLKLVCLLCTSLYIINVLLLYVSITL